MVQGRKVSPHRQDLVSPVSGTYPYRVLRLIRRGDLLASLDRAAHAKVTLISGPAGSGKTSLLRAWADGPGQPYRLAVVQLQRNQQDSQQFWLSVLGAIRQGRGAPRRTEAVGTA